MKRVSVYILGGSGYGGGELLRLLSGHPQVERIGAMSRQYAGQPFWKAHPNLRGVQDGAFDAEPDWKAFGAAEHPVVFSAMPHFELAQQLHGLEQVWEAVGLLPRLTLIDLSGDFRLDDARAFERAYGKPHPYPQALGSFVYGLPEWRKREIAGARRIASPGCFATAVQLALLPLAGLKDLGFIAVSAATGSSGSGASPGEGTHHPLRAQDFRSYKALSHQHEAEIHRLLDAESLRSRFEDAYRDAPFVRLMEEPPRVAAVAGSNFCDVGLAASMGTVAVMTALDNLVKGMAGQAVQCMNLALGFPETTALLSAGTYPG